MTLKRDLVCPNCDGRSLWRIEHMTERAAGTNTPQPLGVVLEPRFFGPAISHGTFETLICARCGFTEWYAKELSRLNHDPVNGIHFIKNDVESKGPYR